MNRHQLIGRLTADPEKRQTPGGTACTKLRIATNEPYRDGEGGRKEHTEYHDVVAFGKVAEILDEYLGKGDLFCVEGPVRRRRYQGRDGADRDGTYVKVDKFEFLSSRRTQDAVRVVDPVVLPEKRNAPPKKSPEGDPNNGPANAHWAGAVPFD